MSAAPLDLIARLKQAGMHEAAVVDETFDSPTQADIEDDLDVFFEELKARPESRATLQADGIPCSEQAVFVQDGISKLWEKRAQFQDPIGSIVKTLFSSFAARRRDPERVADYLDALQIKVHRLGRNSDIPTGVSLVFLDYNLDPGGTPPPTLSELGDKNRPILLSESKAIGLAGLGDKAPFVILFSDRSEIKDAYRVFRQRTGYLGGTFACMRKQETVESEQFYLRLACMGLGHPATRQAQKFFCALKERLETVTKDVRDNIMALEVQDYSMIQRLALADDGEPLGEYLLELFGAVLSHELRSGDKVQQARRDLDRQSFERHLPADAQPSMPVMQIYRAAMTEPGIGPATPHPLAETERLTIQNSSATLLEQPYPPLLGLGDIFASTTNEKVYLVVNASCDLQYSATKKRKPKLEQSVYLIPGRLENLRNPLVKNGNVNDNLMRMEVFELDGKYWRVWWEHKNVISVSLGRFSSWQDSMGYRRVTRLNLSHALAVQRHWTSDVSRVGLPVNFPLFEPAEINFYTRNSTYEWAKDPDPVIGEIILVRHLQDDDDPHHFILTKAGMEILRTRLVNAKTSLQQIAASLEQNPKNAAKFEAVNARVAATSALLENADSWSFWLSLLETPTPLKQKSNWLFPTKPLGPLLFTWEKAPKIGDFDPKEPALVAVLQMIK